MHANLQNVTSGVLVYVNGKMLYGRVVVVTRRDTLTTL